MSDYGSFGGTRSDRDHLESSRENDHPMAEVYVSNNSRATSRNENGADLEKQLADLQRENQRLRRQRNDADDDNDRLRRQRHEVEDENRRLRRKYEDALHDLKKLQSDLANERRDTKYYREANDQKCSKIRWLEEELKKKELDFEVMQQGRKSLLKLQEATDRLRDENDPLMIVRKVLWESWDPIGMKAFNGPSDEYDHYAPALEIMLKKGSGRNAIAEYLSDVQANQIGLSANQEKNLQVADILIEKISF